MLIDDGRVISNFIVQALEGKDITVYGDGHQTRSFCYVDDMVAGLIALMAQDRHVGPVNLGNPAEFTIRELAQLVIELTGSRSRIVEMPLPQDDPVRRRPDITRARELLGWEPTLALRGGLVRTIEYFARVLRNGDQARLRRNVAQ
jgi:UDP-glucuronate decarboxylase